MPTSDQTPALEKFGAASIAAALLAIVLLAWLALRPAPSPAPRSGDAPAAAFATARALPAFRALSQSPRPVASAANARARDDIVQRLQSLDLQADIQTATAQSTAGAHRSNYRVSLGVVHNVLVRLHGSAADRATRPALMLVTHYDSAPGKLGAADSSASVAAMLETLRALSHGAPLANDVIVLFADAGKSGALGARAFAQQHPWAKDVGLVLQFDAAGNSGPLLLTGTRGGNGKLVREWIAAAPLALGSSALEVLARESPALHSDGALDEVGSVALRFANIEGRNGSTGASDLPANVARSTMQHAGETMLALTRHFGSMPLAGIAASDSIHFELPFAGHVQYSADHAWALTRLVCFLFLLACCMAFNYLELEPQMLVAGAMAFVMLVLALASIAITLWHGWPGLHEGYHPLAAGASARDGCYFLAYVTLGVALFIELQRAMHKALGVPAVTLGALLVLLGALLCTSWLAPGASYLLAWPMIAALAAFALLHMPRVKAWPQAARLAIMVAAAAPAIVLLAPFLQQVSTLFTPQRSALLMIVLATLLGLASTLLAALRRRFLAPLLMTACGAALATAQSIALAPAHAGPTPLAAQATRDGGAALWAARPRLADQAFPELMALADRDDGGRRRVAFSLRAAGAAPTVELRIKGAEILSARLNGRLVSAGTANSWSMKLHGAGAGEQHVELELPSGAAATVFASVRTPGPAPAVATETLVFR